MLPRAARLTDAADFRRTVQRGMRAGRRTVVVHAHHCPARAGVRVGFVVAKTVGGAVVRNRVRRRLRHLAVDRLAATPAGTDVVVRALPGAAGAGALADDLVGAWTQAVGAAVRRSGGRATA